MIKEVLPKPFHFQKTIHITPGRSFDVLSWGRGAGSDGQAYLILASDTADARYTVTNDELEGKIVDAWNMDMDSDGNPEIFIEARLPGQGSPLKLYAYEFDGGGRANPLRVPELRDATRKTYRGRDSVYVKSGSLFRTFPTFEPSDTAGAKPTGKKDIEYRLSGSSLEVK